MHGATPMIEQFQDTIRAALGRATAAHPRRRHEGFYGVSLQGDILDTRRHHGVVDYEPSELVMTVRTGTPLSEVEAHWPRAARCSRSSRRASAWLHDRRRRRIGFLRAASRRYRIRPRLRARRARARQRGPRSLVRGSGHEERRGLRPLALRQAGSFGTLALITEVSLKVLPKPEAETTLAFAWTRLPPIEALNRWAGQPLPLSAAFHLDGKLAVRLSGHPPP
jgi:glycolate oxidase FAD binding subunit